MLNNLNWIARAVCVLRPCWHSRACIIEKETFLPAKPNFIILMVFKLLFLLITDNLFFLMLNKHLADEQGGEAAE